MIRDALDPASESEKVHFIGKEDKKAHVKEEDEDKRQYLLIGS